jgi:pimeloyl-ACP methyl ester carboxylesterase
MWRPQVTGLRDQCRLVLVDLPGFGDSPILEGPASVEAVADQVAQTLQEQGINEPVVLGGLSMGGYVAFAFVRKYADRLHGLILADTRAEADDETTRTNREKMILLAESNPAQVVEQMVQRLLGPSTMAEAPEVVQEVRRIGLAQPSKAIVSALRMLRDRPDSTPTLAKVRVPTLVLVGREDAVTPLFLAQSMSAGIVGARLVVIEKAGHLSNLEQPEAFNDAVKVFLQDPG